MASTLSKELTGRDFTATEATGMDLVEGVPITIGFHEDQLHAHAGCNRIFGPVMWSGNTLHAGALASTMMACPDPVGAQERDLLLLLGSAPTATLAGESLTLSTSIDGNEVSIGFTERHHPTLTGTRWVLTGMVKDQGVHSLPEGTSAALQFTETDVAVEFGCNTGRGAVTITGDTIAFGPLRTTRMTCRPPVMEVENHMTRVLMGILHYEIDHEELRLMNAELGLRLRAG